ncbi:MAG: hypothetical protein V1696_02695 [Candidatus Jorgensenbacteria bacterium]
MGLTMVEITKEKIREYAKKYDARFRGTDDEKVYDEMVEWFKHNRFLDRERFLNILNWKLAVKLPFKKAKEQNKDEHIRQITEIAFSSKIQEERIKLLLSFVGVGYPVASAILHFAFTDKYPILDFRVIWSLRWEQPKYYTFDFWQKYCDRIQSISKETGESIRTVDKALWEYSKEHQPKKK